MNRQIRVLTGKELDIVREAMKYLDLSHAVKNKVHNAVMDYARDTIRHQVGEKS